MGNDTKKKKPAVKAEKVIDGTPAVKAQGVKEAVPVPAVKAERVIDGTPAVKAQGVRDVNGIPATHPAMVKDVVPSVQTQTVSMPNAATVQAQTKQTQSSSKPKAAPATASPQRPAKLEAVNNGLKDSLPNPKEIQWQHQNTNDAPEVSPTARLEQARWDAVLNKHREENKPKTLSDLLEAQRKKVETEKTDAAKMQQYYALADAFNALGRMGGAAIGGAIGGDMAGGAPTVPEYQPSKGYIDAFEKAKNANERLRALDDKGFQLAVRDEERSYNQQVAKADREYKSQQAQLDREWQQTFYDYKSKIEQANAQSNLQLKNELEKELLALQNQYKAQYQAIANAHEAKMKQLSYDIVKLQNAGGSKHVAFDDGSTMTIPDSYYESMFNYYKGKNIGGTVNKNGQIEGGLYVDKDSFEEFVRQNPKLVRDFLNMFGQRTSASAPSSSPATVPTGVGGSSFPMHISQVPVENMRVAQTSSQPAVKPASNEPVVDEDGIEWI